MSNIGKPMRRVIAVPDAKPSRAPRRREQSPLPVPDWLDPNRVREPVKIER